MTDLERKFHEHWLGMCQPSEGLVVSVPVLVDAQCMEKQGREVQEALLACTAKDKDGTRYVPNLPQLFEQVLGLSEEHFDSGDSLPKPLRLYVPEGKQELRPTLALKRKKAAAAPHKEEADLTAAASAGRDYLALVWDVPTEIDLDRPETRTGPWEYPAQAKFDRLLRECRVPIGILTNGREVRLTYAPHGESSGWLSFRIDAMCEVGGRPILDAFVMLLGRTRWFGVAEDVQLPTLLASSRGKQGEVTNALAGQLFEALEELLAGFSAASDRDKLDLLRRAHEDGGEGYLYSGLLTVLLRLVFALYCEDRGLLPVESELFSKNYSVFGLYDDLERDNGRYPDSMDRRFGAYPRLVSLFRAMYLGVSHGGLHLPPRHGDLFDPNVYPFLEGWGGGSAPIGDAEARARVDVPAISDGTVFRILKKLIVLGGQRLSYRALDVEQIGSVYEALMGFDVERLEAGAVRIKLASKKSAARVWVVAKRLLEVPAARRAKWLQDELGFDKGVAAKVAGAIKDAKTEEQALDALEPLSGSGRRGGKNPERAPSAALVIQPGPERRRTSSHYTPRSLSEPIVRKTLDPLIKAMGEKPSSEAILSLKICDPAMGSGAFLVAACRYLADHVVAAWTREKRFEKVSDTGDDVVNHARRLVAQRCLYGVDKNRYAVQLARLSLWLVTMAKNEPFTFVDHALRHGDSLVGLDYAQVRAFHWKTGQKGEQTYRTSTALDEALKEAISIRQEILNLATDPSSEAQKEKERLLRDADDAMSRVRLIADLVVGAFFSASKDKDREKARTQRLDLVEEWLNTSDLGKEAELKAQLESLQAELKETQVPFHWHLEFPEVFYLERPDPLDGMRVNGAAFMDAFVGNPPFLGGPGLGAQAGAAYVDWLAVAVPGSRGNRGQVDLCAFFFRRCGELAGAHGTIGLVATNTIGQGDTRSLGLKHQIADGWKIYSATTDMTWPGEAAVTVSVVHLAKGNPAASTISVRNGSEVGAINSRLRPSAERPDPVRLEANRGTAFSGTRIYGQGFVLTPEERMKLLESDPANGQRTHPYMGGEEVNSSPTQSFDRWVIEFGDRTLEEAARWPSLLQIVRERVKPERDQQKGQHATSRRRRDTWWQFDVASPALYAAIAPLDRCLVNSQVSKHLIFARQPTDRIFAHTLYAYPLDKNTPFAVLQSRVHEFWARLLSSSLEDRLRYAASDCFDTFPFPQEDPRALIPELEAIGELVYQKRAEYMIQTDQGLTKTYNALKDPSCTDERILALRTLHEEMDRAVLKAYGWSDIAVPPFCIKTEEDQAALQTFEDEIIDRLFVLNAARAKKEAALGQAPGKKGKKKRAKKPATPKAAPNDASAPEARAPRDAKRKKGTPDEDSGQGSLF